jgi:hypothetical protein
MRPAGPRAGKGACGGDRPHRLSRSAAARRPGRTRGNELRDLPRERPRQSELPLPGPFGRAGHRRRHRVDGIFNPKPIPDLAGPQGKLKISRTAAGALESFIHGLVTEEFDGPEPPPEVLAGLAAYVRALGPSACRGGEAPVRLAGRLAEVDTAVALARTSDGETRRLLLAAARSTLGAIDERFTALPADRAMVRAADADLAAIRAGEADFGRWDGAWPARRRSLLRDERRSLYAADQVVALFRARGR